MKELLKKHGKIIMTILSIGLMLSFAMMGSNTQTPDEKRQMPAGYLNGKKVTVDEIEGYRGELNLLSVMGLLPTDNDRKTWIDHWVGEDGQSGMFWYLLTTEASHYTMVNYSEDEAVKVAVESLLQAGAAYTVEDKLEEFKINAKTLARALSRLETVNQYIRFLQNVARPVSMMELLADQDLRHVQIGYVPIDALRNWTRIPADSITPQQLTMQFEAYKNVLRTPARQPDYPPYLIEISLDANGKYALIGYPGAVDEAVTVRVGDRLAWDGSIVTKILFQGEPFKDDRGRTQYAPALCLQLSGGGRAMPLLLVPGYDLHGYSAQALPAEVNGHRYPFGYKIPDRVRVEYLQFQRAPLRGRLEATATDIEAAIKVFQDNPYKFREPPAPPAQTAPATTATATGLAIAAPASTSAPAPATRTRQEILADWDDPLVKAPYISEQLDLRTTIQLKKMLDQARTKADVPWQKVSVPEANSWIDYQSLALTIGRDSTLNATRIPGLQRWQLGLGFGLYQPVHGTSGNTLLNAEELLKLPGIGRAIHTTSQGMIFDFPTLATNILDLARIDIATRLKKELGREPTEDEVLKSLRTQPLGRLGLQKGHEGPELIDADGNMYLFRVTECEPGHTPESLDLVRGRVLDDCRQLAAYQAQVQEIKDALAKSPDLEALAKQYQSRVREPKDFNRNENLAPVELQYIRDFIKTAFALPDPEVTKKPSVATLADDALFKAYPMKVIRTLPTPGADFLEFVIKGRIRPDPAMGDFVRQYLQIQTIAERLKFTLPTGYTWPKKPALP